MKLESVKEQFPVFKKHPGLVYLDSAASAQKSSRVIDRISTFYEQEYANIHRGVYYLSQRSTELYEESRSKVQAFLNAEHEEEIVFLRGATEAINLIAQTFGRMQLSEGDIVLLSEVEHHANIIPWQLVCESVGASIKVIPVDDSGELKLDTLDSLLTSDVKIISITHTSNALGTINPIEVIIEKAKQKKIPVVVDGCQAVAHMPVDVKKLGCDFYVFSGHKLYGPSGIGALYGKKEHLDAMPPYQGGGDMIFTVSFEKSTFAETPQKFEAGTPNIAGAVGLGEAIDFISEFSWEDIREHEHSLLLRAREEVSSLADITIVGTSEQSVGIVSFLHSKAHPHDVATILSSSNVAVRAGHHCCQPLMNRFGIVATTRASFGLYNDESDLEHLVKGLKKVCEIFK